MTAYCEESHPTPLASLATLPLQGRVKWRVQRTSSGATIWPTNACAIRSRPRSLSAAGRPCARPCPTEARRADHPGRQQPVRHRRLFPLVHRRVDGHVVSRHGDLPQGRPDDAGQPRADGRRARFRRQGPGLARRRQMAADRELPGDRLLHSLRCRAGRRRDQEGRLSQRRHRRLEQHAVRLRRHAAQAARRRDAQRRDAADRSDQGQKERRGDRADPHGGPDAGRDPRQGAAADQSRQEGLRAAGLWRLYRQPARQRDRLHAGLVRPARRAEPDPRPPRTGPRRCATAT